MAAPKSQEPRIVLPREYVSGKIGVVTVTFGSGEVLEDFLASLDRQTYRNFCLIAVDNGSKDTTVEQLNAYKGCERVLIANDQNLGVAAGNNQGIRAAVDSGCEYVMFLNNDVVFGSELFEQLLNGLSHHNCQMTSPLMYYHDRPNIFWAAGGHYQPIYGYRCLHYGTGVEDTGQYSTPRRVAHAPTCCVLARRDLFARIGLMDERYFVYHDDTDFMLRAYKADQHLYCLPNAKLWHKVSSLTMSSSDFSAKYGTRNRALLLVKFMGRFLSAPYILAYRICYLLRYLRRKDDYRTLRLKQSSWTEGSRIPTNWWPA
jgi:GT2 family glycosyltransferase